MLHYSENWTVTELECSPLGIVPIDKLQKRLEETSSTHGTLLGHGRDFMDSLKLFWVVSRLKVTIHRYPKLNETYQVSTWLSHYSVIGVYRHFTVKSESGETLVSGVMLWSVVHQETLSVERIDERIVKDDYLFLENTESKKMKLRKIPELENPTETNRNFYKVQAADIDLNNHVNNTVYTRLILEQIPTNRTITEYEINYLNALYLGDEIEIISKFSKDEIYLEGYKKIGQEKRNLSFLSRVHVKSE